MMDPLQSLAVWFAASARRRTSISPLGSTTKRNRSDRRPAAQRHWDCERSAQLLAPRSLNQASASPTPLNDREAIQMSVKTALGAALAAAVLAALPAAPASANVQVGASGW